MNSILFIGNYPNPVDKYRNVFFQNLIFELADQGIDCTVIAPISYTHYKSKAFRIPYRENNITKKGSVIKIFHPRYVSYSSIKVGRINTGRMSEHGFQHSAVRMAKRLKGHYDCVYGHFILTGGLAAAAVGRELKIPSFIAYGECDYESEVTNSYGDVQKAELAGVKGIIAVSTNNYNELRKRSLYDEYPVLIAVNSIDNSLFQPLNREKCRELLKFPQDEFVVGFVGGFIDRKGDLRLLEAVNQIDGVYCAFAGKGDRKPEGSKVVFCEAIEHEKIPYFLNACNVFALPTLSEGSCNAVIEALACGLPVISSNLPFNDDILNDSNSIRINPTSINELTNAIKTLYENCELRIKLSNGAIETSQELTLDKRAMVIRDFIENNMMDD